MIKTFYKKASRLVSGTLIGKLFGIIKIVLLVRLFGFNEKTDIILYCLSLFWFFQNTLIDPFFQNYIIKESAHKSDKVDFFRIELQRFNVYIYTFAIISYFFSELLISILLPGLSVTSLDAYVTFFRYLIPIIILSHFTQAFTNLNIIQEKYFRASANLFIWNLLQIFALLYSYFTGFEVGKSILISVFLGYLISLFTQYYDISSISSLVHFFGVRKDGFKKIIKPLISFFFITLFSRINSYIDYGFISGLESGAISFYNIALKPGEILMSVFFASTVTVFFNEVSKNPKSYRHLYKNLTRNCLWIVLLVLLLYNLLDNIVNTIIFKDYSYKYTTVIVSLITINVFYLYKVFLQVKVFLFESKSSFLLLISGASVAINFLLNSLLFESMGMLGVAYSTLFVTILLARFSEIFLKIYTLRYHLLNLVLDTSLLLLLIILTKFI